MNRADKMLSVLADGKPHSRRGIFERVGYMGSRITQRPSFARRATRSNTRLSSVNGERVDVYQLLVGQMSFGEVAA